MLPGGFSAGDEPDGSAKFIATIIRNPRVADAIMDLLKNRDGLILGICNGFQALIKTGLVPYGEIREPAADSPTLVHNDIGRHISCYATHPRRQHALALARPTASPATSTRSRSPMAKASSSPAPQSSPNSPPDGQIATQYCDATGVPSMDIAINPNGSLAAIEGITSPCGRVFGKMGHTERAGSASRQKHPRQQTSTALCSRRLLVRLKQAAPRTSSIKKSAAGRTGCGNRLSNQAVRIIRRHPSCASCRPCACRHRPCHDRGP